MNHYGRYCGEHPLTQREQNVKIPDHKGNFLLLAEGCTISGINCVHRKWVREAGWQPFCTTADRKLYGCI